MYLDAKAKALPHRRGHYLAVEILDDEGNVMCRIWDDIPKRSRSSEGTRVDYGRNWPARRYAIVKRDDGACRYCTSDDDLQVHHVVPLREFNGDVDAANAGANLVTLCRACHWLAETLHRETGRILLIVLGAAK